MLFGDDRLLGDNSEEYPQFLMYKEIPQLSVSGKAFERCDFVISDQWIRFEPLFRDSDLNYK